MREVRREGVVGVSLTRAYFSADLGCSSEYSNGEHGRFPCQQQLDTGQSVLRQGVIARLKADSDNFGCFFRFAERECMNIPQPGCREMKR